MIVDPDQVANSEERHRRSLPAELIESTNGFIEAYRPVAISNSKQALDVRRAKLVRIYQDDIPRLGHEIAAAKLARGALELDATEKDVIAYFESSAYSDDLRHAMAEDFWQRADEHSESQDVEARLAALHLLACNGNPAVPKIAPAMIQQDRALIEAAIGTSRPESHPEPGYSIETFGDLIVVRFGDEKGVIQGLVADRLVTLLKQQQAHVAELSGDLKGMEDARQKYHRGDRFSDGFGDETSAGVIFDDAELRGMRLAIAREKEECESLAQDSQRSIDLQESIRRRQDFIAQHEGPNGRARIPKSKSQMQKDAIKRSFERVRKDLKDRMPRFVEHLRASIAWNEAADTYEYRTESAIAWIFS